MRIIFEQKAKRTNKILSWSSRNTGLARVLFGIMFLVLLHNPVPVLGTIVSGPYSVTLAWEPSPSTNVTGYDVYYGTVSGNYTNSILVGNVMTNTVSGLSSGHTYYFAITAVEANGQESPFSNQISVAPGGLAVWVRAAPAGQFVLTVSGLIGQTYEIEATQDLIAWTIIGTVTLGATGSLDFTDTNMGGFPTRFYRIQGIP
jgi:hypothetical protein